MYQIKLLLVPVALSLTLSTLFVNFTSPMVLAETVSFVASNVENLYLKQTKNRNFNSKDFSQDVQRWQDYDRKLQEQRDRQWQNNKRQWQDYNWRLQQRNTPQEWSNDYRQWQNQQRQWDKNPQWQDY
jgi:hypothetical protein